MQKVGVTRARMAGLLAIHAQVRNPRLSPARRHPTQPKPCQLTVAHDQLPGGRRLEAFIRIAESR